MRSQAIAVEEELAVAPAVPFAKTQPSQTYAMKLLANRLWGARSYAKMVWRTLPYSGSPSGGRAFEASR